MSEVFDAYAQYYDLLYQDKDYVAEAEYITQHIKRTLPQATRILELGCGSGAHAEHLAKSGYEVHGIDMSSRMLEFATKRKQELPKEVGDKLSFELGDIRTYRAFEKFDVVISLFHVMSYQTTNADVLAAFETAGEHLNNRGLFLFDYWNGPAVMMQKPSTRVKRFENNQCSIIRIAEPEWIYQKNIIEVNYQVLFQSLQIESFLEFSEQHVMRYFFEPELEVIASWSGMKKVNVLAWMKDSQPTMNDWSAMMTLTKESR